MRARTKTQALKKSLKEVKFCCASWSLLFLCSSSLQFIPHGKHQEPGWRHLGPLFQTTLNSQNLSILLPLFHFLSALLPQHNGNLYTLYTCAHYQPWSSCNSYLICLYSSQDYSPPHSRTYPSSLWPLNLQFFSLLQKPSPASSTFINIVIKLDQNYLEEAVSYFTQSPKRHLQLPLSLGGS